MYSTLQAAIDSTLRNVAGSCPTSPEFLSLLNEAVQRLMTRGDWENLTVPIYVCAKRGCVSFPRYVKFVRKANLCNHYMQVRNSWYQFLDFDAGNAMRNNWGTCSWAGWRGAGAQLNQIASGPTFSDIIGEGRLVRCYPQAFNDLGKKVKLFGVDNNGQPLKTIDPSTGEWSEGISVTLATPFGSTNTYVRRIDRVLKDETTGPITMFAYNVAEDVLEELATYDPSETNPEFTRYNLQPGCVWNIGCSESKPLIAMVKLRFIPARLPDDLVLVQNLPALKEQMQSIKYAEQGDTRNAAIYEARALRELNMELRNQGDDTIPVSVEPFSGTRVGLQKVY